MGRLLGPSVPHAPPVLPLASLLALASLAASPSTPVSGPGAPRTYEVRQTTRLARLEPTAKQVRWWVSIPDDERFQDVLDLEVVSAPGAWRIEREPGRGNRFLYIEVESPGQAELAAVLFAWRTGVTTTSTPGQTAARCQGLSTLVARIFFRFSRRR